MGDPYKYKFGGKEYQDEFDINTYDFGARFYMPGIARWGVIDPKADDIMQIDISPYHYSWNNPVNINDPDGECPWCWGAAIGFVVEYGSQVTSNLIEGESLGDALTNVDGEKILVSTLTGAATGGLSSVKVVGGTVNVYKATAMSATVAGGNIVEQALDGKATVDVKDLALDVITDRLPLPKVSNKKTIKSNKKTTKTTDDSHKAKNPIDNNRTLDRSDAVKKSKTELKPTENQSNSINSTISDKASDLIDASVKEVVNESIKTQID